MKKSKVFEFSFHSVVLSHAANSSLNRPAGRSKSVCIGELIFSDDATRNSLSLATAKELAKYIPKIEETCDVLIFRSEGRVFCSGGNLKDQLEQGATRSRVANRFITTTLHRLSELKIPTIAMVQGDIYGGGIEWLSTFDVVLAEPHVIFGFWQRRLGLTFGWGGGARLVRRLGSATVARLALEARALDSREALDLGLVDQVVTKRRLREAAFAEALRLASLPKVSVTAMKSLRAVPVTEARREQRVFEKLWFGPDHKARIEGFGRR